MRLLGPVLRSFMMISFLIIGGVLRSAPAVAADANVAVATNFILVAEELVSDFEKASGHELAVVSGSTGKIYTQIMQGAPFDVFLAADAKHPHLLESSGHAVSGSNMTYAIGQLVLWSADPSLLSGDGEVVLKTGAFRKLAMANPRLAPYGQAAQAVLEGLGLNAQFAHKTVLAENIGQAFSYVHSGNAELGFVAQSYVQNSLNTTPGSLWIPPTDLYSPIRQNAVLLSTREDNAVAGQFYDYLVSEAAVKIIQRHGYIIDR